MTYTRLGRTIILFILFAAAFGCKSKQEAPGAKTSAPRNAGEIKSISGQNAAGAPVTSPLDKSDAEAAAARVLSLMEAGDFSVIYNEAAPGFKQIGSEVLFVAKFQQTRQKTGPLNNPQEVSFVTRPDKTHVLVYRLENERFKTERRLTFDRSKSGKMELFGLNQHDDPKK
ncbi:MAG TPA: hypothetical protein VHN12_09675 [Geobacteraceae bacterium]|nr:hypothetical protein [Geobacteraceae bacterium]